MTIIIKTSVFQSCCAQVESTAANNGASKRIMLVSDFYYGRFDGDGIKKGQKTNTTFKCQSCLKVLKNNIRYEHVFYFIAFLSFVVWVQTVFYVIAPSSFHTFEYLKYYIYYYKQSSDSYFTQMLTSLSWIRRWKSIYQ